MSKTTTFKIKITAEQDRAARKRAAALAQREMPVLRAQTFTDRRKEASKKACRGRHWD